MSGIKITIDASDVEAGLQALLGKMADQSGFFMSAGEHLLARLQNRFKEERAPDGAAWAKLAPATIAARLANNPGAPLTILRVSGDLFGSFVYQAGSTQVEIGSDNEDAYPHAHHFGAKTGRGHAVTLPARPILGLEPDDPEILMEIAEEWLAE